MKKTEIYIANHKIDAPPHNKIYKPIGVGNYRLPYQKDNTKENISSKNPYYSELTALYWIWKNTSSPIIGLNHYHRYFYKEHLLKEEEIEEILKYSDILIPEALYFPCSMYEQYEICHYINDLDLALEEMIKQDERYEYYISLVKDQNKLYPCNMFATTRSILNDYLSFLFPILFSLEKQIPYLTYDSYQQRVFGFLAERIFNIYLARNNLIVYEYPILDTNELSLIQKMKFICGR